jgi:hypothetical protein
MLLDFLAVVLATGAIIEVWHRGSIFANLRALAEAHQDVTEPESFKGRVLELLMCPFCKSYHVPFWLLVALLAGDTIGVTIGTGVRLVVYGLAATRLSNLVDGLLPPRMRYVPPLEGVDYERGSETGDSVRPSSL